jgi:phosphatidylserine decarboxylase
MYLHSGERVGQGQRCGYFYFGGVVDVFMPIQSKVQVEVGQYVEYGSTVLAQIIHSEVASVIHDI